MSSSSSPRLSWDTFLTAILVATASASETQNMYMAMKQPPLRPPPWIFGPVWTVLYG